MNMPSPALDCTLDTGTPSINRYTTAIESLPSICNELPKSSSRVPLTYRISPAVIAGELSVILTTVWASTTNVTSSVSPINPVVPGVPKNSALKSWKPTSIVVGTVKLTSIVPIESVVPIVVTAVPFSDTVTWTPTTAAPVLSNNCSLALTSSPLSVLSFSEGKFTPSKEGAMKERVVNPRLSKD